VTLDPDTAELLRRRMHERHITFKEALNDAIRTGLGQPARSEPFRTRTRSMGTSAVNLDRALQIAAEIEDDELIRRMRTHS
jgi:hypothetical protein